MNKEMEIGSSEFGVYILKYIDERIEKGIERIIATKSLVQAWPATVQSVDGDNANVLLPGETIPITKANKSNQTLNVGDQVYLFSPHMQLSTAFIIVKK